MFNSFSVHFSNYMMQSVKDWFNANKNLLFEENRFFEDRRLSSLFMGYNNSEEEITIWKMLHSP